MDRTIKIQFTDPDSFTRALHGFLFRHFDLEISDAPDFVISSDKGGDYRRYRCIRILYSSERIRLDTCNYDFTFSMLPVTDRNYYLPCYFFAPLYPLLFERKDADELMKEKTKFCNFVYSRKSPRTIFNYYPGVAYRNNLFHRLSGYKRVDSAGGAFNNMADGKRLQSAVSAMVDFYRSCKFTIAFENASQPGYCTEKLTNALACATVPIYWGDPLVHEQFNPKAFINCLDYDGWDEVIERVVEVDQNDELYRQYLREPAFAGNREPGFLEEKSVVSRFEEIFNTRAKPRAESWRYRPCAEYRHFRRCVVRSVYKWFGASDGY